MEEVFGSQYFEKIGHPEHATYESFRRAYRAMKKRARKLVPTKFEDPDWYSVILEIAEKIDRIVKKHGYDLSRSKPLFGTLPSGNVNAMAVTIPGSFHRLILIEEGLFSFANLMVKAVTAVFSSRDGEGGMVEFSLDEERVEKNLADSAEIQERFLDVIMSYLVNGHPAFAKSYLPDRRSSAFSSYLCNSFEVFVLAHEYGHLIFNSRTDKKDLQQQEREMNPNWIEEFVADTKGLEILIGVKMRGEKGPGSIKGKQSPNKPPQRRAPPPAASPAGKSMPGGAAVGGSLGEIESVIRSQNARMDHQDQYQRLGNAPCCTACPSTCGSSSAVDRRLSSKERTKSVDIQDIDGYSRRGSDARSRESAKLDRAGVLQRQEGA